MRENAHEQSTKKQTNDGMTKIIGTFTLLILCVFPLVYHKYYVDILEIKYQFYSSFAVIMILISLIYGLFSKRIFSYLKHVRITSWFKNITIVDLAVILFWLANVLSWVFCEYYKWEAFWGTAGRYNGVFLITIYMVVYFLTTRFFQFKQVYLDLFLAAGLLVCLFGITDFFQMDLLGLQQTLLDEQKRSYTSTFGNINMYTTYVGAVVSISVILFVIETNPFRTIYYFITTAVSMVALLMGASDNAYLTLAALFVLSPLYLFRRKSWIRRYLAALALLFTSVWFVAWLGIQYEGIVWPIIGIFTLLSEITIIPTIAKALWGIVLVWTLIALIRREKGRDEIGNVLPILWIIVVLAVIGGAAYIYYDANILGNIDKYEAVHKYVVFDDAWGSGRGYAWIRGWKLYDEIMTPLQKIIGCGSDTFLLMMIEHFPVPEGSIVFDSAHNEYLNFLVTIGAVGAGAYVMILGAGVISMIKKLEGRPEVAAVLFMTLAYATQALVTINIPTVFPIIWQLFAAALSKVAKDRKNTAQ